MRAHCHACNTSFRAAQGGRIRCPRCGGAINLGTVDHFFDGPQEPAYFGWNEEVARRRLTPDLDESIVAQAVATVGNAAFRLFRSVVLRVANRPAEVGVEERRTDDSTAETREQEQEQEQKQQQDLHNYTDDLRLS